MSTFSQFAGGLKSVQRGTISIGAAASSGTATITAVVTAKTELRLLGVTGVDQANTGTTQTAVGRVTLTNTTTVTANLQFPSSGTTSVSWELTEWY